MPLSGVGKKRNATPVKSVLEHHQIPIKPVKRVFEVAGSVFSKKK